MKRFFTPNLMPVLLCRWAGSQSKQGRGDSSSSDSSQPQPPDLYGLFMSSCRANLQVFVMASFGFLLGYFPRKDPYISKAFIKKFSCLVLDVFLPCLSFYSIGSRLTFNQLQYLWPLFVWSCLQCAVSFIITSVILILVRPFLSTSPCFSTFHRVLPIALTFQNTSSFPLTIVEAMCEQKNDSRRCFSEAAMYLFIYSVPWNMIFWMVGFPKLKHISEISDCTSTVRYKEHLPDLRSPQPLWAHTKFVSTEPPRSIGDHTPVTADSAICTSTAADISSMTRGKEYATAESTGRSDCHMRRRSGCDVLTNISVTAQPSAVPSESVTLIPCSGGNCQQSYESLQSLPLIIYAESPISGQQEDLRGKLTLTPSTVHSDFSGERHLSKNGMTCNLQLSPCSGKQLRNNYFSGRRMCEIGDQPSLWYDLSFRFWTILYHCSAALSNSVIGVLAGITVGLIGPLRNLLFDDTTLVGCWTRSIRIIGQPAIPCMTLILASSLAHMFKDLRQTQKNEETEQETTKETVGNRSNDSNGLPGVAVIAVAVAVKSVMVPVVGIALVLGCLRFLGNDNPIFPNVPLLRFVIIMEFSVPASQTVVIACQRLGMQLVGGQLAYLYFWMYLFSFVTCSVFCFCAAFMFL
eukprot:GHVQ01025916.1.p1 GENE.GHVQ01025916.1~~GHVQ01025916.1.p1  ORF type:complete len:634 (-),score=47.08 GHVQ01025916.1:983-2884(-)